MSIEVETETPINANIEEGTPVNIDLDGSSVPAYGKPLDEYQLVDMRKTTTYNYADYQHSTGKWCIIRRHNTTKHFDFITGQDDYTDNFEDRETLDYVEYPEAF